MNAAGTARVDARVSAAAVPAITGVKLSPGDIVDLINISRSGMLVEGKTRLVPGTRVTITFEGTFTPAQIRAKIIRCQVSSISGGSLRYQCGVQFDAPIDQIAGDESASAPDVTPPAVESAAPVMDEPAAPASRMPLPVAVNRW